MNIRVGLVDDHQMFLRSLSLLLTTLPGIEVCLEALDGKDMISQIERRGKLDVDIMLLDVNMPNMDGFETASWLREHHPLVKVIALSMNDKDRSVIRMFSAGCCAYLLKDMSPDMLERALNDVSHTGYFNYDSAQLNPAKLLDSRQADVIARISKKELEFLKLACSEMTYKQIASEMKLSERTIDGYRESLFGKLNVQSRVGLCLEAIRLELVVV